MGNTKSKPHEKHNKNHITKKGFQFGVSFGREDLTMEGNVQIGWTNKTVKNYTKVPSCKKSKSVDSFTQNKINDNDNENFKLVPTDSATAKETKEPNS